MEKEKECVSGEEIEIGLAGESRGKQSHS